MSFNKSLTHITPQFKKFIIVGISSTFINYLFFYILLEFLYIDYLVSSGAGFIVGVFSGYIFNRKWTFNIKKNITSLEIIKYFSIYIISLILSLIFLKFLVDNIGINIKIANIFSIGLTTCTNFLGLKLIVFNNE